MHKTTMTTSESTHGRIRSSSSSGSRVVVVVVVEVVVAYNVRKHTWSHS